MTISRPSIFAFRTFVTIFGAAVTLIYYLFQIQGTTSSYLTTAISLFALITVLFSLKVVISTLGAGPQQLGFRLIFVGVLSSCIGLLLWATFFFTGQLDLAATVPSFFFYSTYILNFLGFLKLGLNARIDGREFIGVIVGFGLLGLILTTIANALHPFTINLFTAGFLLGDALRIIMIALMLQMVVIYQGGLLGRYWLSIFVGNIFILFGNFASSILIKEYTSTVWPFPLIDLLFIGGYLFVAHGYYGIGDSLKLALRKIAEHKRKQSG